MLLLYLPIHGRGVVFSDGFLYGEDLRAKDLRVLARLILIERNAKKSGVTIEVISEIEGLEKALETLRTV